MGVAFTRKQALNEEDLYIMFLTSENEYTDPFFVEFNVDYIADNGVPISILEHQIPAKKSTGYYYAPLTIPESWDMGPYRIKWFFQQNDGDPYGSSIERFQVISEINSFVDPATAPGISSREAELVYQLRIILRDNNPDKYYHFRPYTHPSDIRAYNKQFDYIWTDTELLTYLRIAMNHINIIGVPSAWKINNLREQIVAPLLYLGATLACKAVSLNWTADQFQWDMGGISINYEKASEYITAANEYNSLFESVSQFIVNFKKKAKGLRQGYFLPPMSLSSMWGPYVTNGTITPRSWVFSGI